jgi:GT2 family glycosyltransferase|tara:strand:+ start:160 stop:957 length:798 start_codon:yes stop_codon:yes gene_type:complete
MSRIGIGIITCNRPEFFKECRESIKQEWYDRLVVVNDGTGPIFDAKAPVIGTGGMEGVGRAKNKALEYLLEEGCDYIILVEDDMLFKGNLFKQYIKAHKATGIHHFMFAYHGPANKANISGGKPVPRKIIDYGKVKIALNQHCVGAVCFYTKECLDKVGLYDESYTNAFEHVDHSYELAKAGYSTPYWWWADIENSLDYVVEQACSENSSAIRPRSDWQSNIQKSAITFSQKHGVSPVQVKDTPVQEVINSLKKIKNENRSVLSE